MNTALPVCLASSQLALHSEPGSYSVKENKTAEQQISLYPKMKPTHRDLRDESGNKYTELTVGLFCFVLFCFYRKISFLTQRKQWWKEF